MNQVNKAKSKRFVKSSRQIDNVTLSSDQLFIEPNDRYLNDTNASMTDKSSMIDKSSMADKLSVTDEPLEIIKPNPMIVESDEGAIKENQQINKSNTNNTDYLKRVNAYVNCIDGYRRDMYNHLSIILVLLITYLPLGGKLASINLLLNWMYFIGGVVGALYIATSSIYLFKIIKSWDKSFRSGIIRLWDLSTQLSIKNYRLTREYKDIYQFHYNDIVSKLSTDTKDSDQNKDLHKYVKYILKNDTSEKMDDYTWCMESINRVNQYIQLSYYLSFLGPNDKLEMKQNNIYVNITSESVMNRRNRKLESMMNTVPLEYKNEIIDTWTNVDLNNSDKFMVMIPCKWIIYEYRNLFRYLYCAKYFKNIYTLFEKDYTDIENLVHLICRTLQDIFRRDTIYLPDSFVKFYSLMGDGILLILDNLIAINILYCAAFSISYWHTLIMLFMMVFVHVVVHCIIISINNLINAIKNPLREKSFEEKSDVDTRIETIFNEMKIILINGKGSKPDRLNNALKTQI